MENFKNIIFNYVEYGNVRVIIQTSENFELVYEVKSKLEGFDIKLYKETFIDDNEYKREFIKNENDLDFFAYLLSELLLNKNKLYVDYDISESLRNGNELENLISILGPMLEVANKTSQVFEFYKKSFNEKSTLYLKEKYKKNKLVDYHNLVLLLTQFEKFQTRLDIVKKLVNMLYFVEDKKENSKVIKKKK